MSRAEVEPDWRAANRAVWDEKVGLHLGTAMYDLSDLRAGRGRLCAIEEAELGPVDGLSVLHLQCHFGADSLVLASRGARVTGVDFSPEAVRTATALAGELGLSDRARFVESDLYAAPEALGDERFDLVFTTWGTVTWLPDIERWAGVVAGALGPGGRLYFADAHPVALVFDEVASEGTGIPGPLVPYFGGDPYVETVVRDYADDRAVLEAGGAHSWVHPLGRMLTALITAGLEIRWVREHDAVAWDAFDCLVQGEDGLWRWPDRPWLPLSVSISAERAGTRRR